MSGREPGELAEPLASREMALVPATLLSVSGDAPERPEGCFAGMPVVLSGVVPGSPHAARVGFARLMRRFRAGRSRQSILLIASRDVHVFVWSPRLGADSYGVTVRHRTRSNDWLHWRLVAFQHGSGMRTGYARKRHSNRGGQRFLARRTLTLLEASRWRTVGGTDARVGLKAYVRLKVSPGGRQV